MEEVILHNQNGYASHSPTLRDLLTIAFRHRRLMVLTFFGILSGAILAALLQPNRYDAAMKILVKRDRVDPVVTAEATAVQQASSQVSEEELNSEVELLRSRELLEKIVLECGLQHPKEAHGRRRWIMPTGSSPGRKQSTRKTPTYVSARPLLRVLPGKDVFKSTVVPDGTKLDVQVRINEAGHVIEAHIKNGAENNGILTSAAITAAKQWKFEPAKRDRNNIAGDHTIEFRFRQPVQDSAIAPAQLKRVVDRTGSANQGSTAGSHLGELPPVLRQVSAPASQLPVEPVDALALRPQGPTPEEGARIANAVLGLEKDLRVEVVKRTNLIAVSYQSQDPQLAARVLATLANLYLVKHVTVHRPPGTFNFFQQETEQYREALAKAEARLLDFNHRADLVSAPLEKEAALQRLAEFKVALNQTDAAIAETQQRILKLQEQGASTPKRMVTEVRNTDDGALLSQLRSNLLALEQKRTELLGKFEPGYRLVQEVEAQIAQVRAALASAEKSQLHEETTDRDPTYEWGRAELAKAKADLAGLQARAKATALALQSYQDSARSLGQKEVVQNDLVRNVKATEENYLLYLHKEEEARMSDALDRGRILNVAVAEAATVPSLPSNHRSRTVFFGALLAAFMSVGMAFVSERLDSTFRTPDEVGSILNIPVLATIPHDGKNRSVVKYGS